MTDSASFDLIVDATAPAGRAQLDAFLSSVFFLKKELTEARTLRLPGAVRFCGLAPELRDEAMALPAVSGAPIDLFAVPAGLSIRSFRLMALDMDSTLTQGECLDIMAGFLGRGEEMSRLTLEAMRGSIPFRSALEERCAIFRGAPEGIVQQTADALRLSPGAEELVDFARAAGLATYVVSGGFIPLSRTISRRLGMTGFVCNELEARGGLLTGRVLGPGGGKILDADGKRRAVEILSQMCGCSVRETLCGGDGMNDIEMVKAAGLGFSYHGKPRLETAAPFRVRFGGLDVVKRLFVEAWEA